MLLDSTRILINTTDVAQLGLNLPWSNMDPLVAKAMTAGSLALVKKIFGTGPSGARLVERPVRLGGVVRWRWSRRNVAEKDVERLVWQLMRGMADVDPSVLGINQNDGNNLISSLTATLLALDAVTMDIVQVADLDASSLADMLTEATRPEAITLTVETRPVYRSVLNSCCLHIIDHFSKAPEFNARSQVETVKRLGKADKTLDKLSRGIDAILKELLQEDGITVWTSNDFLLGTSFTKNAPVHSIDDGDTVDLSTLRMGRIPNLQLEYAALVKKVDKWLMRAPQKRGERLRVFWIEHNATQHRSKARLACLSRAGRHEREVLDAGSDLNLASRVLKRSLFSPGLEFPPIISVDLSPDSFRETWSNVRNFITRARTQFSARDLAASGTDIYPRLLIAGTRDQRRDFYDALLTLVELDAFDIKGLYSARAHSFHGLSGLESQSLSSDSVYNRGLPITTRKLVGRKKELTKLRAAWQSAETRIISIVASGGTGKSALVNTWLNDMRKADYRGASRVLAWSFYSQGTKENLVSADPFINFSLEWLGAASALTESAVRKGMRLASLIQRDHYLLVLDGMEPLQYPPTAPNVGGRITDDSMKALLEELANSSEPGLCIITTRVPLTDLRDLSGRLRPNVFVEIELDNLRDDEAAALLKLLIQKKAPLHELVSATNSVENHALAVTLLGNYLRDVHDGDLAGRFDLKGLSVDIPQGGHARRIMASYVRWLWEYKRAAELSVLHVIGLFDRPAPEEAMQALLSKTDLDPFTVEHEQVGSSIWYRCVEALRGMGLLNGEIPDSPGTLDAHPLVREHFREELQRSNPEMWATGNVRLYSYYREHAPDLPADSKGMSELYAAVTHGCAANLYQEVFDQVLLPRVWRDRRTSYSTRRLGMTGSDLVALSNYFEPRQWRQLRDVELLDRAKVLILTNAGVRLRQLGRLSDARECFGAVVDAIDSFTASPEEFDDAAYAAGQYCELLVISGALSGSADDVDTALLSGQRAVEFADRGNDPYFKMHSRSSLAEVHLMLGNYAEAQRLFESARSMKNSKPPFLYSQSLFRYGYYLIETGQARQIIDDESDDPYWGTNGDDSSLLSKAIRLLILGSAHRRLMEDGDDSPSTTRAAERILNDAIVAFRDAGYSDYLVRGLLERAHFFRVRGRSEDYNLALQDLSQGAFETNRGQMHLLYCDILLQRVACLVKFAPKFSAKQSEVLFKEAKKSFDQAKREVDRLSYGRRMGVLKSLKAELDAFGEADRQHFTNHR